MCLTCIIFDWFTVPCDLLVAPRLNLIHWILCGSFLLSVVVIHLGAVCRFCVQFGRVQEFVLFQEFMAYRYQPQAPMMMQAPFQRGFNGYGRGGLNIEAPKRKGMLGKSVRQFNCGDQRWDREDSDGERVPMDDNHEIAVVTVDDKKGLQKIIIASECVAAFLRPLVLTKTKRSLVLS